MNDEDIDLSGAVLVRSNGRRGRRVGQNDVSVVIGTVDVKMPTSDASTRDDYGRGVGSHVDRAAPDARWLCGEVSVLVHESDPGTEDVQGNLEA